MNRKKFVSFIKKKLLLKTSKSVVLKGYTSKSETPTSITLLAIREIHKGTFALLPSNLDLQAHLEKYPLTDYGFKQDGGKIRSCNKNGTLGSYFDMEGLIHIIDLLSSIPANNKDSISGDGFVSINSTIIRGYLRDYLCYLDYLILTNVIMVNGRYIPGKISKGYKLTPQYEDGEPKVHHYRTDIKNIKAIQELVFNKETNCTQENQLINYNYLSHWYNQKKLTIDISKARKYAYLLKEKKFNAGYENWDINRDKWSKKRNYYCRKYPKTQYVAAIHNIEALEIHNYKAKIDTNVHRLHSVLTNIQKDYKPFIGYDGQPLVSIDITNSQPYLMNILFNPEFWKKNSTSPLSIYNLPPNIQSHITPLLSIMIGNYLEELDMDSLEEYRQKTSEGEIYEKIIDIVQKRFGESLNRKQIKTMFYIVLFSKNGFFNQPDAKLKRLFKEIYPQVYELTTILKTKNHATLAILLQAIESEIILHRCCKRVWEEGEQQVPVFTIHDSIVTTKVNEDFVKKIMTEELAKAIGVPPTLQIEEWREDKLEHQDILIQINSQKHE